MSNSLEPGFYWVKIDGGSPVVAQLVTMPLAVLWRVPGDDSIVAYERGEVLGPRLVPPSVARSGPLSITEVMNQLAQHGESSLEVLARRLGCAPEVAHPFVDRLLGLRIVECIDGQLYRLQLKDCEHKFLGSRNCAKCGINVEMLKKVEE